MTNFLPKDYEAPVTEGNYYKLKKGENRFRILSPAIVGYEYWTLDKKPVRSKTPWEDRPANAKVNENGTFQKFFWAFVVWNYDAKKPQIMEITQKTIQDAIEAYWLNKKWGDPVGYDIVVTRTGDGLETVYTTIAEPHSEAPKADISKINLEALFAGADPFSGEKVESPDESLDPKNIPF